MSNKMIPDCFNLLISDMCIEKSDIVSSSDGFFLVYKSLSSILAVKSIFDFSGADGERLYCDNFFDDWFLYAVSSDTGHTYGLLKMREQEHDAESGAADGDTPGVTISFISFDVKVLLDCLKVPDDENRIRLDLEINRVVAFKGQRHHKALKEYFKAPQSQASYIVAALYAKHIAAFSANGYLETPLGYRSILKQSLLCTRSAKGTRLPRFIESLNKMAGYVICDNERIFIKDKNNPSEYECLAILATHTGNTSIHSFAAEVEFHAKYLVPLARIRIPFYGRSVYDSAIRADMTIDDAEFEGFAPFYRSDSRIVKRQYALHSERSLSNQLNK